MTTTSLPITSAHDVAIIGAGPIGLEVAVCLKQAGIDYIHFDAHQVGYTMTWWPRNTNFFSTTERLAIAGVPIPNNHQQRITGEEYLAYLRSVVELFDLHVQTYEPVIELMRDQEGFTLITQPLSGLRRYRARRVVLAIGDMHFPHRLNIPGEDLPHVSHYFRDPHDYFRRRLLIIGGKNSAVEAALRCWRAGAQVTLSYRRAQLDAQRVKHWLLPDFAAQVEAGTIRFLPQTTPVAIDAGGVWLAHTNKEGLPTAEQFYHPTDFVLLATGFRGDQRLLEQAGVILQGPNRVPVYDPNTMETNVPGLYLAGTVAAGIQQRYTLFIENCHEHAGKIAQALTGRWPARLGDVAARNYQLSFEQIAAN
ncbi:NAD(P)-binding domain-containing protein [Chloroflexus sp.]|uniref:NAD(P)-binding domain-containing protein n=1 Tax=Chloroflexus sp. TaxID=1904827 RepID=UPI0026066989|nr:NAD(P)-binding domain-containing protein [uncultured Chloroflexus sp.]